MTPERIAELEAAAGDGAKLVHVTPAIDESCDHDWHDEDGIDCNASRRDPDHCVKCGLSFTRYIHCCMP